MKITYLSYCVTVFGMMITGMTLAWADFWFLFPAFVTMGLVWIIETSFGEW